MPMIAAQGGGITYLRLVNDHNFAPGGMQRIRTAIWPQVDGLVIPDRVPEAEDTAIKDAIAAGITVIPMNTAGAEKAIDLGTITSVWSDENVAGVAGGEYLGKAGKKVICANACPGAANTEARCARVLDGVTAKGGTDVLLPLPTTSFGAATAPAQTIKAELPNGETIDAAITRLVADADNAAIARDPPGSAEADTRGMTKTGLDRIKAEPQAFAIEHQRFLPSYLASSLLAVNTGFGTDPLVFPVLTGPGIAAATHRRHAGPHEKTWRANADRGAGTASADLPPPSRPVARSGERGGCPCITRIAASNPDLKGSFPNPAFPLVVFCAAPRPGPPLTLSPARSF